MLGYGIKQDEMGKGCSTQGKTTNAHTIFVTKLPGEIRTV
jgi:hypothetical protein